MSEKTEQDDFSFDENVALLESLWILKENLGKTMFFELDWYQERMNKLPACERFIIRGVLEALKSAHHNAEASFRALIESAPEAVEQRVRERVKDLVLHRPPG